MIINKKHFVNLRILFTKMDFVFRQQDDHEIRE